MRSLLLAILVAVLTTPHVLGSDDPRRAIAAGQSVKSLDHVLLSSDRSVSRKHGREPRGIEAKQIIPDICKGC